jgi:N-methylhydantoinase A/oxoprolinase/acetone carboxylase beta subunit
LDFTLYDQSDPKNFIQFSSPTWKEADLAEKNMNDLIQDSFVDAGKDAASKDLVVEVMKLRARVPVAKVQPGEAKSGDGNSSAALKGERMIHRGGEGISSSIYDWNKLAAGNAVTGPAVLEGSDTTYVVPQGWRFVMDTYGNGELERE